MRDLRQYVSTMERYLVNIQSDIANIHQRLDTHGSRLARIERRFELAGAPGGPVAVMRLIPILIAIVLSAAAWAWPAHAEVSGQARVVDGDSLEIGGARIRLFGIDAPERGQSCQAGGDLWICGGLARVRLEERISGRAVVCEEKDRDRYGRIVAVCRAGGEDLNAWMVSEGWALAYRRYSEAYVDEEAEAKAARLGVWRGEFVPPWDWRRGKRLPLVSGDTRRNAGQAMAPNRTAPRVRSRISGGCRIKGNISRNGRIYHVPGGYYYERTRIDMSKGERWFCSEAEARVAGWRRSRR